MENRDGAGWGRGVRIICCVSVSGIGLVTIDRSESAAADSSLFKSAGVEGFIGGFSAGTVTCY